MQRKMTLNWQQTDLFASVFVLILLLWFTYVFFVKVPYAGFYFNPTNGEVVDVYTGTNGLLHKGDVIKQIDNVSWNSYKSDATRRFFVGTHIGQAVHILISRNGHSLTVSWPYPGFNQAEFRARFFNVWWLGYFFWFFGFVTQLLIRPRNALRRLMITANYLTGLWLICGTMSGSHVGGSLLWLSTITWLMLPVYLNLHWNFPEPLSIFPKMLWIAFYLVCGALAISEFLQVVPTSLYALGFLLTLLGSLILLIAHFIGQPAQRHDVGLLLMAILIAVLPSIGLGILYTLNIVPGISSLTLLFLPIMPSAYFFIIYRYQLGGLELRANRIISIYSYLILLGTALLFLTVPAMSFPGSSEDLLLSDIIVSLAVAFFSILVFPRYQSFVERRLLGIKLPYQRLLETYTNRITTSTSLANLIQLLDNEVLPSLFLRQFAFLQILKGQPKILLARGLTDEQLPQNEDIAQLMTQSGVYLRNSSDSAAVLSWIRLVMPLIVGENVIGLWLLGRRDPDDVYSQADIPILQSLANQTAMALSNIHQTDQLRMLYQENINRHERERMRLAMELHDGVLNQMAFLSLNLDPSTTSFEFKETYDQLTLQLREIVGNLRPPLLQYGLKPALEQLAYSLVERSQDRINTVADIQALRDRYPESLELHIFRIVQEASENALRHAQATRVKITARLEPNTIEFTIEDNGVGFDLEDGLELEDLLAKEHFGLVGIMERCRLIGAEMRIKSSPQNGVQLHVTWSEDSTQSPA